MRIADQAPPRGMSVAEGVWGVRDCPVCSEEERKGQRSREAKKGDGPEQIVPHTQGCGEYTDLSPASACSATMVVVQ